MIFNKQLGEIMTKEVITLNPDDSVAKVAQIFDQNNIHHIPIVDAENTVVGIVSKSDFLLLSNQMSKFTDTSSKNQRFYDSLLVSEIMTERVATLHPEDSVMLAASIFKENILHALPIVDKWKKLVGLVTTFDLLNFAFEPKLSSFSIY